MLLNLLKLSFLIISALFITFFVITAFTRTTKKMKPLQASAFVSANVGMLFFYVINAVLLFIFLPDIQSKAFMLLFGLSPFIIGQLASYKFVKLYSVIQILCVIISCGYILII